MNNNKNGLFDKLSNVTDTVKNVAQNKEVRDSVKDLVKGVFKGLKDITDTFDVNKHN